MDQAERLRNLVKGNRKDPHREGKRSIGIYTVASGKGGVGKTNIAVNLAIALQRRGKKVLIIDADLGMANVDVVMGIYPEHTLYDVLFHEYPLKDAVITGYEGIRILPGGSGIMEMAMLDLARQEAVVRQFMTFDDVDMILIDTGAGISRNSLSFITFSQELILVTTPEPTALTDAYSVIKILAQYKLKKHIKVIVNRCPDIAAGDSTFEKLNYTSETFLGQSLERMGNILNDTRVVQSVMNQVPFIVRHPGCMASKCIDRIADEFMGQRSHIGRISSIRQVCSRLLKVFG